MRRGATVESRKTHGLRISSVAQLFPETIVFFRGWDALPPVERVSTLTPDPQEVSP
jgi:hypothetical protein